MADLGDTLQWTAPQITADSILGPCAIGWMCELMLGGMATALAGTLLLSKTARIGKLSRPLLALATVFNLACMAINAAVSG
jgi:hypothetical protein